MLRGGVTAAVRRGLGHQVLKLTPTTAKRDEMRPEACGMSREEDGKRESKGAKEARKTGQARRESGSHSVRSSNVET